MSLRLWPGLSRVLIRYGELVRNLELTAIEPRAAGGAGGPSQLVTFSFGPGVAALMTKAAARMSVILGVAIRHAYADSAVFRVASSASYEGSRNVPAAGAHRAHIRSASTLRRREMPRSSWQVNADPPGIDRGR